MALSQSQATEKKSYIIKIFDGMFFWLQVQGLAEVIIEIIIIIGNLLREVYDSQLDVFQLKFIRRLFVQKKKDIFFYIWK